MGATLSVTMANYNHAHFLPESLGAILAQSVVPDEIIVVDDGSTDDSVAVLRDFARRDPRIRIIYNERNIGPVLAGNRAIESARGDYIYATAADDRVLPGLFEKSIAVLERHPRAALCFSDPATFVDGEDVLRVLGLGLSPGACYFSPEALAPLMASGRAWIAGHTAVLRRSAMVGAGGFSPALRWHCDWFTMLVMSARGGICYIPEALASLRLRHDSYSGAGTRDPAVQREVVRTIVALLKSPEYRDVLPFFRAARALERIEGVGRTLVTRPEHWDLLSRNLLHAAFVRPLERKAARVAPAWSKPIYRRIRNRWRARRRATN